MSSDLHNALKMVADEKRIELEDLVKIIEEAVAIAASKRLGKVNIEARFLRDTGEFELFEYYDVVEQVEDTAIELNLEDARERDENAEIGSKLLEPVILHDLGRIAAQSVRRMIHKKGRELELLHLFQQYTDRKGEVIIGRFVKRVEGGFMFSLDDLDGILPESEQLEHDRFTRGKDVKLVIADVEMDRNRPVVKVSRVHPNLLKALISKESPEVLDGIVEIVAVARDSSGRAKVLVKSKKEDIDPVGACVGIRGSRIQPVVKELAGEKIDIFPWSDDPAVIIASALVPAKNVKPVIRKYQKIADVILPEDQVSPAIGKRGVNVRLAAQVTGFEINVMSAKEYDENIAKFESRRGGERGR